MQGGQHEFVLHFDVDAISSDDFRATNHAATGGLSLAEVQQALAVFGSRENMIALEVAAFNPAFDHDGKAAKELVELIAGVLTVRLGALESPAQLAAEADAPEEKISAESRVTESPAAEPQSPESLAAKPPATEASVVATHEETPGPVTAEEESPSEQPGPENTNQSE